VSYGIFHKRRRKIMARIPSKARVCVHLQRFAGLSIPWKGFLTTSSILTAALAVL
jgi:hypothetical protein